MPPYIRCWAAITITEAHVGKEKIYAFGETWDVKKILGLPKIPAWYVGRKLELVGGRLMEKV